MNLILQENRHLDVICLGRAGIDLYANEKNTDFSEVSGFKKFVGGSAANIAVASARLGLKTGFIGSLSEDIVGNYVRNYLKHQNIDLFGLQTAPTGSRTSLAITEMKSTNCGVVLYRNDASDVHLEKNKNLSDYISSSKILVVTGTALASSPSSESTFFAIEKAQKNNTCVVLDLDYRSGSWSNESNAGRVLREASKKSDIVVGNREEFNVLKTDLNLEQESDEQTAKRFLTGVTKILIIKSGEQGSKTYTREGDYIQQGIFPVDVIKPFGAGDSFLSCVIYGIIRHLPLRKGIKLGAASAAINVSSDNCTEAMPTMEALENWIHERV